MRRERNSLRRRHAKAQHRGAKHAPTPHTNAPTSKSHRRAHARAARFFFSQRQKRRSLASTHASCASWLPLSAGPDGRLRRVAASPVCPPAPFITDDEILRAADAARADNSPYDPWAFEIDPFAEDDDPPTTPTAATAAAAASATRCGDCGQSSPPRAWDHHQPGTPMLDIAPPQPQPSAGRRGASTGRFDDGASPSETPTAAEASPLLCLL